MPTSPDGKSVSPRASQDPAEALGEEAPEVAALIEAWGRGERLSAADVMNRSPGIDDEAALRLIYEETCLRREAGLECPTSEVVRRYPRWGPELRALFRCDRLLRPSDPPGVCPEVGETLGPFRLIGELGRGASGRTYLATDPRLADRPVVLKVVSGEQDEHLALASLRHTHIVPLFSAHSFPERNLRALCMPYLGGTSLARILEDVAGSTPSDLTGLQVVELLDRHTVRGPTPIADGPFRRSLSALSYEHAILWIAACLADALHYAHARGVVHLDVKPSNVLIGSDGQPMLLDFHLARGPIRAGESLADGLGGTPDWMSPEQEASLLAAREGKPAPADVDGRTDIYALGLVLREALRHLGSGGPASPHTRPYRGSVALDDLIRRCLAPCPHDRYPDAAALADDLRRQVSDLPLRGVRNRSHRERFGKWCRRHPGARAWGIAASAILVGSVVTLGAMLAAYRQHVGQVEIALEEGRRHRMAGRWVEAGAILERARAGAAGLPFGGALRQGVEDEIRLASAGQAAAELHRLADRIRYNYGVELPPRDEARSIGQLCRAVWNRRWELLHLPGSGQDPDRESRIRADLLEIAAIDTDLRDLITEPGQRPDGSEIVELLDQAEKELGPSIALALRRRRATGTLAGGPVDLGPTPGPQTPWEHYDLARFHLRTGRIEEALAGFLRVLEARPQDFWSNFYQGLCCHRLRRFDGAVAAFQACVALRPTVAICAYNRALAQAELGRLDAARRDYDRCLALDPDLAAAYLNRGILSIKQSRIPDAVVDLERGLRARPDRATSGLLHYNIALARIAEGQRPAADPHIRQAIAFGCPQAIQTWGGREH